MKKFSVLCVAQVLLFSLYTQAKAWDPKIPEIPKIPAIPKIDFGVWGYLIEGILIIVAAIIVYRLVKWLWVGIYEIAADLPKILRSTLEASRWLGRSAETVDKKLVEGWQKHNMSEKTRKAAAQTGQIALVGLMLGGKGLRWFGRTLWAKVSDRRVERKFEKL